MKLSAKFLIYNFLSKGVLLMVFLISGPYLIEFLAVNNTDRLLQEKKEEVIAIIEQDGIERFISEENRDIGYGSYNLLKEEYILIERVNFLYASDTIFVEQRILDETSVSYRVLASTFLAEDEVYLMEIGRSLETIQDFKEIVFRIFVSVILIFLILSFLLDYRFSQRIMAPFHLIVGKKLSSIKEPQQFVHDKIVTNTEEFETLDLAISAMMRRIQKAFNQERIFISHASHELKTPISILQSKVEAMFGSEEIDHVQMEKLVDMQGTISHMKKTVNALLLISKVNNAQFIKTESVKCNELLAELFEDWEGIAKDKSIDLKLDQNPPYVLKNTNQSLLLMMVRNAISNAIKYTPRGGCIRVFGELMEGKYTIVVSDTGFGIPDEILKQVKEGLVFLKDAEKDKSGFGMQLMFKIAVYLNVDLKIQNTEKGTRIEFAFPIQ
ncbi:sensor histidine kinase [Mongoliibacter ruber]|uniref:histidine kinase n=1 Tax=Mongoliibacter ruber TaxID=1750599 RepID=A0A2T0WLI4_9BACT|nr:HAMP domain-containing sensor histidine kinase [Mongoliibacter ruber]PRY87522.1 signal transduction histidine kinase [Mongoliibacter ruber]